MLGEQTQTDGILLRLVHALDGQTHGNILPWCGLGCMATLCRPHASEAAPLSSLHFESKRFLMPWATCSWVQRADTLHRMGAAQLLVPMLTDSMVSVRYSTLLALGRLANVSDSWSKELVQRSVLPQLTKALG